MIPDTPSETFVSTSTSSAAVTFVSTSPFASDQPAVGKFKRAKNASDALNTTRALADPGYAYAVLEAYIRGKFARGRNKFQIQHKLDMLERRMPHFAADFHAVRANTGLAPSRALPPAPPPPYSKQCSCACTCGAHPGGSIGDAHDDSPSDTPLDTPGIHEVPIGPLAAPGSPNGSDMSLPRALSPTGELVMCALAGRLGTAASSTIDVRTGASTPTIPYEVYTNPNPTPTPYWNRGGGRHRSLSVQVLSSRSVPVFGSASASTTNLGTVPMSASASTGH
ncbi:hypothetical protein CcaverHIS002_0406470 [Cutaneotrichosporon cavernicola]|uniref:Uncharacterized protein n=1 Tax=Cutaneotrichosporon cavernicola TaxID=279322 RepID=A0AA48L4K4_9TREE|nr:uncharacterized protein CcaverHIS019_0406480 [Cutaneotrichosporon cavernicola]BEI84043.1 hypothetical protein CcaverHIS002_0406470 [Cutaneotrichosporon cavernicola]BEI91828.1 hypothetical protein CcaverHIS019_0406480 [Cutaneotrichosporon cavernicola]BEI99600.1 hypothetical protein CcaverHIS631_0406430 [Cutaneotrichosporon cavernicola]BEJ07376.1 hypothetical protein CcaverHIS641_0406450 [Cutaneotrichosporon cavernicola]